MRKRKKVSHSVSEESESDEKSSSEEVDTPKNKGAQKKITEYERQRNKRIEENRERMKAMGLKKMADSLVGSIPEAAKKTIDRKGKRKVDDDDEEYMPSEGEKQLDSSSEEEKKNLEDTKGKKNKKIRTPTKKASSVKGFEESDFVDDNEALLQAIALSLQDSTGPVNVDSLECQSSTAPALDITSNERKENSNNQENTGKRKKGKLMNSRVQMTEDELILHFFQFDEAGRGSITFRDLRRMVTSHDFTWSDKEMEDMIKCFDSDGDGKLSLDDFRNIASRCRILQTS